MPLFAKDTEDWQYMHFSPDMTGWTFREVAPGLFELVLVKDPSSDPYHSTWYTFPKQDEYSVSDLYSKHPSKPNLWLYAGRSDDVIVFSTGEKTNPNAMQDTISSYPEVKGVLIVGQSRFQTAALIECRHEPPQTDDEIKSFVERLEPFITAANEKAPAYAKLQPDYVLFAAKDKPFLRADKGTIKRLATMKLYESEIEKLYEEGGTGLILSSAHLDTKDEESLNQSLKKIIYDVAGFQDISTSDDLFGLGMDSLQVMSLVKYFKSSFTSQDNGKIADLITTKLIYSNPTISRLSSALIALTHQGEQSLEDLEQARIKGMEDILQKYSKNLPKSSSGAGHHSVGDLTVVLTGSTGSLGSYLLDSLLGSRQVKKVICLNRGSDGEKKQETVNTSRGLTTGWGSRAQFFQIDLSKEKLGLANADYSTLSQEASFIIRMLLLQLLIETHAK